MRKHTNTLTPSPKGFQSPKFLDSDFREVRGLGLGLRLGRPKSSAVDLYIFNLWSLIPTQGTSLFLRVLSSRDSIKVNLLIKICSAAVTCINRHAEVEQKNIFSPNKFKLFQKVP
jgi:hypothetical protein